MGCACSEPFALTALYDEIRSAGPYAELSWEDFETVVDFVSTGGYALRTYDKFRRIVQNEDGLWTARNAQARQQHRMNVGAIVSPGMINIRIGGGKRPMGGRKIGEAEEGYFEQLTPGDTFVFAGQVWRYNSLVGADAFVSPAPNDDPKMPSWGGSKFPLSTYLASRVRQMMHDEREWTALPPDVQEWLSWQKVRSAIPGGRDAAGDLPARQALPHGLLSVRGPPGPHHPGHAADPATGPPGRRAAGLRLQRLRAEHLVAAADGWPRSRRTVRPGHAGRRPGGLARRELHDEAGLQACALIAGLIERRHPGAEKSGRQVTFSTDLIYDVLRKHQPDHLMLRCARHDAATGCSTSPGWATC
jgi:ATP-dependent Lhr-like helicase